MNSCVFLQKMAVERGDQAAIVHGDEELTYREFYDRSLAIGGNLLDRGLRCGDRVAFVLANSPRVLEIIYGCFAAGLVVVPINARLHPREMAYIAESSGARVLVHGQEHQDGIIEAGEAFAAVEQRICLSPVEGAATFDELLVSPVALDEPVDVQPEEPCWLFYTSGTTGRPKGATWSHRTVRVVVMNHLADVQDIQPGDVVLHCAPLSHGSGIVALPAVARGATQVIVDTGGFDPKEVFGLVERRRVGHVAFMAPTQIIKCLEDFVPGEFDLSSLRSICYGGAPIYVEQLRRAIDAFGPVFVQIYGQGEAPMTISRLSAAAHAELLALDDERIGSTGTIRTDVEVRVVDDDDCRVGPGEIGEIVVRGDVVMLGYWNDADATVDTLRGGWLHTGDLGRLDDRGYLFILDRVKDMIISGGNNVYPREVEEVLATHPAVATVVVVGVPDDYWGEAVHAVVVLRPGAEATAGELIDHCGRNLAGYKKPKAVDIVEALPVSGHGKVLRREVRAPYWAGRATQIGGGAAGRS